MHRTGTRFTFALAAAFACLPFAAASHADDSFQGTLWSLTYSGSPLPDADPLHETFRLTLSVDTNLYSGSGSFLDQVALKIGDSLLAVSLNDAPYTAADWILGPGGLNGRGCSGHGSGFVCANSAATLNGGMGVPIDPGNGVGMDYSWVFDVTVHNGALFGHDDDDDGDEADDGEASIKARFVTSEGVKAGALVSEEIALTVTTVIPEPQSYALLLAGLALLGFVARRHGAVRRNSSLYSISAK